MKNASLFVVALGLLCAAGPALQAGMFTKRTYCHPPYAHPYFGYYPTEWRPWPPVGRPGPGVSVSASLTDVSAEEPSRSKTATPPASLGSPDSRK